MSSAVALSDARLVATKVRADSWDLEGCFSIFHVGLNLVIGLLTFGFDLVAVVS